MERVYYGKKGESVLSETCRLIDIILKLNQIRCNKCEHSIIWKYNTEDGLYNCESCKLIGESHYFPFKCPINKK